MNWSDRGLVLGMRSHGESAVVLEALTRQHGRHLGLVQGGRSRRVRPMLQPGNAVVLTWRARLDEQLGTYAAEAETMRAARLMGSPLALSGLATLCGHLRLLAEREPHPDLFDAAELLLERLDDPAVAPALLAGFELMLLRELGFGLDLTRCALSGTTNDLAYVSPKSGRAASREAGAAWQGRLLALPGFLRDPEIGSGPGPDIADAFRLTGHFLEMHVWGPRGIAAPDERTRFVARAVASGGSEAARVPGSDGSGR